MIDVQQLTAQGFRNLAPISEAIDAPVVLVQGDNAQGKTNLLEVVHLCATGRSFRGASPAELVRQSEGDSGPGRASASAVLRVRGVRHEVRLAWAPIGPSQQVRQRLSVDGRLVRQAAELLAWLNVVAFFPEDLRIAKAGPEARRRFFDRAVAGGRPDFVTASVAYQRALKARNALLRQPRIDAALLRAYEQPLASHGAQIHWMRVQGLAELLPLAQTVMQQLMPAHALHLRLHSGFALPNEPHKLPADAPVEAVQAHLLEVWARTSAWDRARGMTLRGPHRADLLCTIDGRDARAFASQGQQRCLVLALKIAELQALAKRQKGAPLLLLDDVSSELDPARLARLFEAVAPLQAQVWVSSTGALPLPIVGPKQCFLMREGRLQRVGP